LEAHGQWLQIESRPGVGSTFTFALPTSTLREVPRRRAAAPDASPAGPA